MRIMAPKTKTHIEPVTKLSGNTDGAFLMFRIAVKVMAPGNSRLLLESGSVWSVAGLTHRFRSSFYKMVKEIGGFSFPNPFLHLFFVPPNGALGFLHLPRKFSPFDQFVLGRLFEPCPAKCLSPADQNGRYRGA